MKSLSAGRAKPGRYSDGDGLTLLVRESGTASWVFRYQRGKKRQDIGLGGAPGIGLAQARRLASQRREGLANGEAPRSARAVMAARRAASMTFSVAVVQFLDAQGAAWRNAKHRKQWRSTLDTYAMPVLGTALLSEVTTDLVMRVLSPLWASGKIETGSRLRGRIERILDWAKVRGLRDGENPARWRGHISHLLPAPSKVKQAEHHAAVAMEGMSGVMTKLAASDGTAALAVRFAIFTAARPGEVRAALWSEIDESSKTWVIPAAKMKAAREHRVPLSRQAMAVLAEARKRRRGATVFPGGWEKADMLSLASMSKALRLAGGGNATVHGTARSTFRDWCSERLVHPELAERALAHTIRNKAEAAYRRTDLLEERRPIMQAWADTIATKPSGVAL